MTDITASEVAKLISELPPAPPAWVEAAQSLPALRRGLEGLVERCRSDLEARAATLADLERALTDAGLAPDPHLRRYLRLSLEA